MSKPFSLVLNATETAALLLLNNAVLDVIDGNISEDVISELKEIQPNLEQMLFKKKYPLHSRPQITQCKEQHKVQDHYISACIKMSI